MQALYKNKGDQMSFEKIEEDYRINYEKSYVAFLDVLGFKNLVYSKIDSDKKKIETYFATVHNEVVK